MKVVGLESKLILNMGIVFLPQLWLGQYLF